MTFARLLLRNLVYHRRGNFAVFLGVVVGTAVLTGALLVGDSLRGSLRDLTLRRLGWVDHTLVAGRFFREELADGLPADRVAPAVLLQGAASRSGGAGRVNKVVVLGLVTSKSGTLEKKDDVKRRIEEATAHADLNQLALSPQCGFASTEEGNVLAEEEQWAKLKMVVDISREVWG